MPARLTMEQIDSKLVGLPLQLTDYAGSVLGRSTFRCDSGHSWQAPLNRIFNGHGCPDCANVSKSLKLRKDIEWYRAQLPPEFICLSDEYVNVFTGLLHRCLVCGHEWENAPHEWLHQRPRRGCPRCGMRRKLKTGGYSLKAVEWIELLSRRLRLRFQHIENGGEFKVASPEGKKRFSLDGYNPRYNLALEYFGDYWHTRHGAYEHTLWRLNHLLSQGMGVIFVWESEYKQGQLGTLVNPNRHDLKALANRASVGYIRAKQLQEI